VDTVRQADDPCMRLLLLGMVTLAACADPSDPSEDVSPDAMPPMRNGIEGRWHLTELEEDLFCHPPTSTRITIDDGEVVYWDGRTFGFGEQTIEHDHAELFLIDMVGGDYVTLTLDDDGYRAGASDILWRHTTDAGNICSVATQQAHVERSW